MFAPLLALILFAAACGGDEPSLGDPEPSGVPTTISVGDGDGTDSSETTAPPETTETTAAPTTEPPAETTTSTEAASEPDDGDLPGTPFDFGPAAGQPLIVVGVRYDDSLNFRARPGVGESIVTDIAPLVDATITAAGEARQVNDSIWWKVIVNGSEAWANQKFLGMPGATRSIFDEVAAELGVLKADSLEDMVDMVLEARNYDEDPPLRIEFSGEPLAFEGVGAFAVVDVLGFGDDALRGERLRIEVDIVQDAPDEPIQFVVLTEVESQAICSRGVTEGLCL